MSEELRPCPFCGGDKIEPSRFYMQQQCQLCRADAGLWNKRPIEDALRAENEKLREICRDREDRLIRKTKQLSRARNTLKMVINHAHRETNGEIEYLQDTYGYIRDITRKALEETK